MLNKFKKSLEDIQNKVKNVGQGLEKANKLIIEALTDCDVKKFDEAKQNIRNISNKTAEIDHDIITTLALYQPEAKDLRKMVAYLKITNELLRASSSTRSFIRGFQTVCAEVDIKTINQYAIPMQKSTVDALQCTIKMIDIDCADEIQECYDHVLICESKTDDLYDMIESSLLKDSKGEKDFTKYHQMLSSLRKSEKIADRAMSIASLLLYANNGGELHQI
jgi:phosphate transport system protein